MYLRPSVISANILEAQGIFPLAAIGAAIASGAAAVGAAASSAAVAAGAAASSAAAAAASTEGIAMMAGYASGRAIVKAVKTIPSFRLPSLVKRKENDCDISMA